MEKIKVKTKKELQKVITKELDNQGPDANLNHIDVSDITDMSNLFFYDIDRIRDIKIDDWNVSNVENMNGMFFCCTYFNCDLSRWNVSKVKYMESMFEYCHYLNTDLSKWDTSNVEYMDFMFGSCIRFRNDLSSWHLTNIKKAFGVFSGCLNMNKKYEPNFKGTDKL